MEISPRPSGQLDSRAGPSSSGQRAEKTIAGSGSSEDSMASELGRLSEENAHYRRKISELMGKSSAQPTQSRSSSGTLGGVVSTERLREQLKKLKHENARLVEVNSNLERRVSGMRMNASSDQLWRYKEEIRNLRRENADLLKEKQKFDRAAEYVCQRVLKIIGTARREGNFNSQLVGELKRWNEKLEEENHRLYSIIERMQNKNSTSERDSAVAEANVLSEKHDRDRDGNAALVRQLENQNLKLQEEISKLSDQAISLQNLSSSSSGSSGLAAPRTPSNHEDGPGRRSRTPERDAIAASERLRSGELNRRKSRNMSLESIGSASTRELENDQLRLEKKNLEEEISRIGKHLDEIRRESSLSKELQASNAQQTAEIQKLTEASAQVRSLEQANANQAAEIKRLLEAQLSSGDHAKAAVLLKEEYAELEDDCLKLAAEVERLQPIAEKCSELEVRIEAYEEEIAMIRSAQAAPTEVSRLKEDNVEIQRTLEALAAEKSVLQAQLRELMEERARLQTENRKFQSQVESLQERASEVTALRSELEGLSHIKGQNATYRNQLGSLRSENISLQKKASDLSQLLSQAQQGSMANSSQPASPRHGETRTKQFSSYTMERRYSETSSGSADEIAALKAECKELSAQASKAVEMNVELTSLRNQIKTLEESEEAYLRQAELVKHLQAENSALQHDARDIDSLRLEIEQLQRQVRTAEEAQRNSEKDMAGLLSRTMEKELSKQNEETRREVSMLQARCERANAELAKKEAHISTLQTKHDALLEECRLSSEQASRSLNSHSSEVTALHLALDQEKAEASRVSAEAAELHSLLQTGKLERQTQVQNLNELQAENSALAQRVAELDAKNDENERVLASVLSRSQSNGHHQWQHPNRLEDGLHMQNGYRGYEAARQSPAVKPIQQMNNGTNGTASGKHRKAGSNGKTSGFGNFFKRSNSSSSSKKLDNVAYDNPLSSAPAAEPTESTREEIYNGDPEEEVISMYERFVDHDDIDGFMSALGYEGFRGPTEAEDLEGAFVSARYACRPESFYGQSKYAQAKGRATLELLEAWQAAWQTALSEA